jgi:hypothetical protein
LVVSDISFRTHFILAATTTPGKRPRDDVDKFQRAGKSKLYTLAPSLMGKLTEYNSCQNDPEARILDDRPRRDPIPPPSLLYEGFGHFMDSFRRRDNDWALSQKQRDLEAAVDRFAERMTRVHRSEDERRESGLVAFERNLIYP